MTARELARQLDVSMRTIYRDVETLSASGVPIHMERGPLGGIVLADDYRRAIAQFTNDELQALFAAPSGPMADLGLTAQSQALQKLAGALPDTARRAVETGRARLFVDHNRWSRGTQPTELLVRLRDAAAADRCVRVRYRDRNGATSDRNVDPLGLVAKAGVWYLIAREPAKGYRTFRAQRISDIDVLPSTFERPADFDLQTYWNDAVMRMERPVYETYDVVLHLDRSAASHLAYWDVTVLNETEDGTTVRVVFPSRSEAIAQVFVLAAVVRIVAPADLSSAIVDHALLAIARFDAARET